MNALIQANYYTKTQSNLNSIVNPRLNFNPGEEIDFFYAQQLENDGKNEAAFNAYYKLANRGLAIAIFQCGCMYLDGKGVDRDVNSALLYLTIAKNTGVLAASEAIEDVPLNEVTEDVKRLLLN